MFGFIERDYIGRFCQEKIAETESKMNKEFEKHKKINDLSLEEKIIPFRGHHLLGFKRYILARKRDFNGEYGKAFFQKECEFYNLLLKGNSDILLKIIENQPDFICNLGCLQRKPSCFIDFDANAKDYDMKRAEGFGFKINQTYSSQDVVEKLKISPFKE